MEINMYELKIFHFSSELELLKNLFFEEQKSIQGSLEKSQKAL